MRHAIAFDLRLPGDRVAVGGNGTMQALRIAPSYGVEATERQATLKRVRRILKARRARAEFFDGDLFADPAWDILLELFASELVHRRLSVSDVCSASDVPTTTALRWIGVLERRGLIQRRDDPQDARRVFVELSDLGSSGMKSFFRSLPNLDDVI